MGSLLSRVMSIFEASGTKRYRIACLYEDGLDIREPFWRAWPELFDAADALVRTLPQPAFLRSVQYDPVIARQNDECGEVTRFRKLGWSEKNNRKWVDDLLGRPDFQLGLTEIWSPWVKELDDRSGGPLLYAKIDAADSSATEALKFGWQSFTLAIRHDQFAQSMEPAQTLLDRAAELMPAARRIIFDRGWAERGNYTSFIRVNGLEDSYPGMLQEWCDANRGASVERFDAPLR